MTGNSGAKFTYMGISVSKIAAPGREAQLQAQCWKQKAFEGNARLKAPRVLSEDKGVDGYEGSYSFTMERLLGTPAYKQKCDLTPLLKWLAMNHQDDRQQLVTSEILLGKLKNIAAQKGPDVPLGCAILFRKLYQRILKIDSFWLPAGPDHGDLTLCNVMVSGQTVYLFDFLPSYIQSPALDVVKLRQDTLHGWVQLFDKADSAWLSALDDTLLQVFGNEDWFKYYWLLQAMNIVRIFPYAKPHQWKWIEQERVRCIRSF